MQKPTLEQVVEEIRRIAAPTASDMETKHTSPRKNIGTDFDIIQFAHKYGIRNSWLKKKVIALFGPSNRMYGSLKIRRFIGAAYLKELTKRGMISEPSSSPLDSQPLADLEHQLEHHTNQYVRCKLLNLEPGMLPYWVDELQKAIARKK